MIVPFLIMLREGLEAALIIGIIAGYLARTGRNAFLPAIWIGVFLALAVAFAVGAALKLMSAEFPQKAQELFEASVALMAVVVLTSMVFWMRRASISIGGQLRGEVEAAFASGRGATLALIGVSFLAVGREGLEAMFFLTAVFREGSGMAAPVGALLGLGVAVGLGYGFFAGALRIDLGRFFRWTGVFVLVVAAGLLASALTSLHEAGLWNLLQSRVYDLTGILPVASLPGTVLAGLFGYQDSLAAGEAIAYVAFLAVTLTLFLKPPRVRLAVGTAAKI
jgi:high-affinity iron transporter